MSEAQDRTPRWSRRKEARPGELLEAALDMFVERGLPQRASRTLHVGLASQRAPCTFISPARKSYSRRLCGKTSCR